MCAIVADFYTEPFPDGIFHGITKPSNQDEFLKPFVDEAKNIFDNGLNIGNRNVVVKLNAIICDAPAKAMICCIKSHTGYFSCTRCIQQGDYIDTVVFPELNSPLRTDESFKLRQHPEHHIGEYKSKRTLLESLNIGMVTQIPLDCMHLIYSGVTQRLLRFFIKGPMNVRLNSCKLSEAELRNAFLQKYIPTEFARRLGKLSDFLQWKATQYRLFLLYVGIIIMQNVLPKKLYTHFTCLVVAIRILCDKHNLQLIDYAQSLLQYFVRKYSDYYGEQFLTHNVHNLIHLCDDVKRFGPIDSFSAFKFESYLYKITQHIKIGSRPLEQLVNRFKEEENTTCNYHSNQTKQFPIIYFDRDQTTIKYLEFSTYKVFLKIPNNCCLLRNGTISILQDIYLKDNILYIAVKIFQTIEPFF